MALLQVNELGIEYHTKKGVLRAVDGVQFSLEAGENLGIVGESGCGKTTVVKAILRILPGNARVSRGQIYFKDKDILSMDEKQLGEIRWKEIAMIPQSALNALNPVYRIEDQMVEIFEERGGFTESEARRRSAALLDVVGLNRNRLKDYPHQFSGGMRQRVSIAMALALNPALIIADEPTTALDVLMQDEVLQNIIEVQRTLNKSMILITHDISIVAENCDTIAVMYAGKLMEYGNVKAVFRLPSHPYTIGLRNACPSLIGKRGQLISIPGSPPNLIEPAKGCRFYARCPFHIPRCCEEEPSMTQIASSHFASCHRVEDIDELRQMGGQGEIWERASGNEVTI